MFIALTEGQVRRRQLTVSTLKGGVITPVTNRKGKQKGISPRPNPKYAGSDLTFGTKSFDADLHEIIDELTK